MPGTIFLLSAGNIEVIDLKETAFVFPADP
jgi:hypothetical protein